MAIQIMYAIYSTDEHKEKIYINLPQLNWKVLKGTFSKKAFFFNQIKYNVCFFS